MRDTSERHTEAATVLVISGWRVGADKVAATRLLSSEAQLGLARAKRCIDQALGGHPSRIRLADSKHAENLRSALDAMGWVASLEP